MKLLRGAINMTVQGHNQTELFSSAYNKQEEKNLKLMLKITWQHIQEIWINSKALMLDSGRNCTGYQ